MTARRRFSITEAQAETLCTALRMALEQMYAIRETTPYTVWRTAEMETLLKQISNYSFYKEE